MTNKSKEKPEISVFKPNLEVEFEVMDKKNHASDEINLLLSKLQNEKANEVLDPWLI